MNSHQGFSKYEIQHYTQLKSENDTKLQCTTLLILEAGQLVDKTLIWFLIDDQGKAYNIASVIY